MSLAMVASGSRVRFLSVDAGCGLRCRLAELGLVPGTEIEVLRNSRCGPFLVAVRGCRFLLGRDMASKIFVE